MTVYVAYFSDMSDLALFDVEIDALRFAVLHSMQVKTVTLPCEELRSELNV